MAIAIDDPAKLSTSLGLHPCLDSVERSATFTTVGHSTVQGTM